MKLSDIWKEINKDIDDSLPNGDLTGWINRALDDLSPHANVQKSTTISLVADQKEYNVPADLLKVSYFLDENKPLHPIAMNDFHSYGFKRWGDKFIIQPTPKEAKTLDLYYQARLPHVINSDDVPAIPEEFHDLLVLYAVAMAKYQDEELEMQQEVMQRYLIRKEEFIQSQHSNDVSEIQDVSEW
jgi:hypothetical protein